MRKLSWILAIVLLFAVPLGARSEADGPVAFADPVFEALLRAMLERPQGDILASECAKITELHFSNLDFSKADWDRVPDELKIRDLSDLRYFPNLEVLEIGQHAVSDLAPLAALSKLRYLDAPMNLITDISPIAELTGLDYAVFWQNKITDISPVANLTNLTIFSVFSNNVSDISALSGLTKLTILELHDNPIADFSPVAAIYPNLAEKDFDMKGEAADPKAAQFDPATVISFPDAALESRIRKILAKPEGDITAADAASVTYLGLSDSAISDLTGLEYFVNADKIEIVSNAVTDLSPLSGLYNLGWLDFGGNQITDLSPLAELTNLKSLALWGNQITDLSPLARMTKLESLAIHGNQISDISALSGMKKLTILNLRENPIADFSPVAAVYPNLTEKDFDLPDAERAVAQFDPATVIAFPDAALEAKVRAALGKPDGDITAGDAASLTLLNLSNEWQPQIPEERLIYDLTGIEYFVNVDNLALTFNAISDVSPLAGLQRLVVLDLGGNRIADLSPLSGLTGLKNLTLFGNGLTDISALAPLTGLDLLYIHANQIADISALAGMANLHGLMMSDNQISDLSPLAGLPISELWLANNPIADYAPIMGLYDRLGQKDFEILDASNVPDEPLVFADPMFERALRQAMNIHDRPITQKDAFLVTNIEIYNDKSEGSAFADISPLAYFVNLKELEFNANLISDLTPLAGLTKLTRLNVSFNQVSDLTPLAGLTNLGSLALQYNQITDVSPLANLTNLYNLELRGNNGIVDVSPLSSLTNLSRLTLSENPVEDFSPLKDIYPNLTDKDFDLN